jgi:hypothetical protein
MDRRQLLALLGTTATTAIAGCSGGGNEDPSEDDPAADGAESDTETATATATATPPSFTEVELTGPAETAFGDPVPLEVSATNEGGTTGTYEDQLIVSEGNLEGSTTVEIPDVEPGASETATVEPPTIEVADTYGFELEEGDAEHTVEVTPNLVDVGETQEFGDLAVTVTDVRFPSILASNGDGRKVFAAPSERGFVLVQLTVENRGTSSAGLDGSFLSLSGDGEWYDRLPVGDINEVVGVSGRALQSVRSVEAAQEVDAYLVGQLPLDRARGEFELYHQLDSAQTPPEYAWTISGASEPYAAFELREVRAPNEATSDESYELSFDVANVGEGTGTFRGALEYGSFGDWTFLRTAADGTLSAEIAPGETATVSTTNSTGVNDEYTYRLAPFDETWTTNFTG